MKFRIKIKKLRIIRAPYLTILRALDFANMFKNRKIKEKFVILKKNVLGYLLKLVIKFKLQKITPSPRLKQLETILNTKQLNQFSRRQH